MSTIETLRARYERDVPFKTMVDVLTASILRLQLAPSEIREAAMYAIYRAEILYPPNRFRSEDDVREAMRQAESRAACPPEGAAKGGG